MKYKNIKIYKIYNTLCIYVSEVLQYVYTSHVTYVCIRYSTSYTKCKI